MNDIRSIESPTVRPGAVVIRRVVNGEEQAVVVCERCEVMRVIDIPDAMMMALQSFLSAHDEERHQFRDGES